MRISTFYCLFILLNSNIGYAFDEYVPWVGQTLDNITCTGRGQGVGPYDYNRRAALGQRFKLIVGSHFTPKVKNLIGGHRGYLKDDIDYTLRAIPNHHEALLSTIRYEIKRTKKLINVKAKLVSQPECYIQRAINFRKKDPVPYSLYGYYLGKMGKSEFAVKQYKKALQLSPDSAKIEYSYSLLLINLKRYDQALEHAKKAYKLGNPPAGLRNKLIKLGKWK